MRKIVVSVQNGLLAEGLIYMLKASGEFEPFRVMADRKKQTVPACAACMADIALMEVSRAPGAAFDARMKEVQQLRETVPDCRVVLLCDENVSPEIARRVIEAKKNHEIDAFFYSSVTAKYLVSALYAL